MTLGHRIEERLRAKGWSQAELARRIGVQSTSIWKLVNGQSHGSKHLHLIARELDTTVEYLLGETDDNGRAAVADRQLGYHGPEPERSTDDLVEVAEIDPRFGAGGVIMDEHAVPEMRTFSRTWLRQITSTPPEELYWARPRGNSMAPTIGDGEPVLIDRRQDTIRDADLVWAFAWGDVGAIKRLRPLPNGTVEILSDNPSVPPAIAHEGEIHIFGRVVAVVKKV